MEMIDRESYRRGFEDALEAIDYLVRIKKMKFKKAIRYLLNYVKENKIEHILKDIGMY